MAELKPRQVAVVTGGASGIGLALVEAFVRKGLRVAIADMEAAALADAVSRLREKGGTVVGVTIDVADRDSVRSLREQVLAAFGAVDVLCNNAGQYNAVEPVWNVDITKWRRLFEVNYWGVVYGIQEFVPIFLQQASGHIVTTASMSGLSTVPGMAD